MFYSLRLSFAHWQRFSSLRWPIFFCKEMAIKAQVQCSTYKASLMSHSGKRCAQMNLGQDLFSQHAVNCFCSKSFTIGQSQRRKSQRFSPLNVSAWLWQEVCQVTWQLNRDPILPDGQEIGQPKKAFPGVPELEEKIDRFIKENIWFCLQFFFFS